MRSKSSVSRLPSGYTVKFITSSSIDPLKNPLKVEKDVVPPLIQVQIEATPYVSSSGLHVVEKRYPENDPIALEVRGEYSEWVRLQAIA
jgi:hypothetical protein